MTGPPFQIRTLPAAALNPSVLAEKVAEVESVATKLQKENAK